MRNLASTSSALLLAALLALAGSAQAKSTAKPSRASAPPQYSGFLQDYSLLKADPSDATYLRYVAPDFQPAKYQKFVIAPPVVMVDTGGQFQAIDTQRLSDMTQYYMGVMSAALSKHYQVVTDPGPGVATIRVAVVGAVEVRPRLKPRDALPVSILFKAARAAAGKSPKVLRMSIESEAVDSQTGALLGETVDSRESTKKVTKGKPAGADQLHQLINFWVDRFVAKLDKANGFTAH